jgi:hypothetical protein
MIGGGIMKMQVAPFAVLGMLVIPVAICALGIMMFQDIFQSSSANYKRWRLASIAARRAVLNNKRPLTQDETW